MSDPDALVKELHRSPLRLAIVCAGGGTRVLPWLLSAPGASRTVLDAQVPYDPAALAAYVGAPVEAAVSPDTAKRLAECAFHRARALRPGHEPLAGVACTAALGTDRERRGEEQAFICVRTEKEVRLLHLQFRKGAANRDRQENGVAEEILNALAATAGAFGRLSVAWGDAATVETTLVPVADPLAIQLCADSDWVRIERDGRMVPRGQAAPAVLSGSFHPSHAGHLRLADVAEQVLECAIDLELSQSNADKSDIFMAEVARRIDLIRGLRPVLVTRAPTFLEKARLFPGRCFVLGYDTAARLVQDRFYGGADQLAAAFRELQELGCQFLVAGREEKGTFRGLDDIALPDGTADLFQGIPEQVFREDVSSTAIRGGKPTS